MRLCVLHNLYFYNTMMEEIRAAIEAGNYKEYKEAIKHQIIPKDYRRDTSIYDAKGRK